MIAEFLQQWCDQNNKLVLVTYDSVKGSGMDGDDNEGAGYKLKLEIFGYKKVFVQTSCDISDALNQVAKQAINFLLRLTRVSINNILICIFSRFQLHPADLPTQLLPLFKRRGSCAY